MSRYACGDGRHNERRIKPAKSPLIESRNAPHDQIEAVPTTLSDKTERARLREERGARRQAARPEQGEPGTIVDEQQESEQEWERDAVLERLHLAAQEQDATPVHAGKLASKRFLVTGRGYLRLDERYSNMMTASELQHRPDPRTDSTINGKRSHRNYRGRAPRVRRKSPTQRPGRQLDDEISEFQGTQQKQRRTPSLAHAIWRPEKHEQVRTNARGRHPRK